jgi:HEAT repeat protein
MTVTLEQVLQVLSPEEPDYSGAERLGLEALSHLITLVTGSDPMLASKAAYLASLIKSDQSADVLRIAAQSQDPIVRVAAAAGVRNLSLTAADQISLILIDDPDVGVRKVVLKSLPTQVTPQLRAKLEALSRKEDNVLLRRLSTEALKRSHPQ